jgi:hypothetical protein
MVFRWLVLIISIIRTNHLVFVFEKQCLLWSSNWVVRCYLGYLFSSLRWSYLGIVAHLEVGYVGDVSDEYCASIYRVKGLYTSMRCHIARSWSYSVVGSDTCNIHLAIQLLRASFPFKEFRVIYFDVERWAVLNTKPMKPALFALLKTCIICSFSGV